MQTHLGVSISQYCAEYLEEGKQDLMMTSSLARSQRLLSTIRV